MAHKILYCRDGFNGSRVEWGGVTVFNRTGIFHIGFKILIWQGNFQAEIKVPIYQIKPYPSPFSWKIIVLDFYSPAIISDTLTCVSITSTRRLCFHIHIYIVPRPHVHTIVVAKSWVHL